MSRGDSDIVADTADRVESSATPAEPMNKGAMALLGAHGLHRVAWLRCGLPLIRLYLLRYLGAVPASTVAWHVGMLGGVYLFALFLFAPLWGRLSDRRGRVGVLLIGFATFLVGSTATALAPNMGFVYAARLLAGAGAAAIVPTAQAYIADSSTTVDRSRRFVLLGSSSFIGFLAGPAFGTWLAGPAMGTVVGEIGRHAELARISRRCGRCTATAVDSVVPRSKSRHRRNAGCGRGRG
jgi:MFS family permease